MPGSLLKIENLFVAYRPQRGFGMHAVSDVSLSVTKGESLGLVGESGCGKTSLARAVMQFVKPVRGRIIFGRENLTELKNKRLRQLRPKLQMIFQDSISALNPRRSIGAAIAMPLKLSGALCRQEQSRRVCRMMERVGLDPSWYDLLPHQLSGGQCQRVQIARALITQPELLICDEPVSSLDVSVRAQIICLLNKLRESTGLTMLFISHDLGVVRHSCDRIAVMYAGKLCEISSSENLYREPLHPYAMTLLSAIPKIGEFKRDVIMEGMKTIAAYAPDDFDHGCRFRAHCFRAKKRCIDEAPELRALRPGGYAACHYP